MSIQNLRVKADSTDPYNDDLVSITINDQKITIVNPWTTEYNMELPASTADDFLSVVAEPANKKAIISIEGNRVVNKTALVKITVTSENRTSTEDYYVNVQIKEVSLSGNFKDIKSGEYHSIALKTDGTLYSFGENNFGQLGDGSRTNRLTPVQVKNLSNVIDFDTSSSHSIAATSDGSVWVWGLNDNGQLYNKSKSDILTPMKVTGISNIVKVRAGNRFSLALDKYGAVWFLGYNAKGQYDDEVDTSNLKPTIISGLSDVSVKDISVGDFHCMVLTTTGRIYTWGANDYGQLGDGTKNTIYNPVLIPNSEDDEFVNANIKYINANGNTSSCIKNDGTAYFWGKSDFDEESVTLTPKLIEDMGNASAIDANSNHIAVLKNDGKVQTMGNNSYGQLADGSYEDRTYFSSIYNVGTINRISTAQYNTFLVGQDGYIYGSGRNHFGQLGINQTGEYFRSLQKLQGFNSNDNVSSVYANYDSGEVSKGTRIRLNNDTLYSRIYYTLDGTDPTSSSMLYTDPIVINEYTVLKAIAIKDGRYSAVTTYEYLISTVAKTEMNINIPSKACKMGETIEIPITFSNVPSAGVATVKFAIKYNPQVLSLQSINYGELIEDSRDFSYSTSQDTIILDFIDSSKSTRNITQNGVFATLKFYVRYNIPSGRYSLSQGYILGEGAFFKDSRPINLYYNNGYVDVNADTVLYGDVDNDGKVTALDLQYIQRYLSSKITEFPYYDGFKAADADKDGSITSNDLELIKKIILK
jgi:alpha-tubulin suppressor-like RCC1 family protein